jgi:hypothetical protein
MHGMNLLGGRSSSTPPPAAADPFALAQAQTGSNVATAQSQAALNNINTISPYGASTYTSGVDPATGQTRYTLNQQLSPQLQDLFGTQTNLADILSRAGVAAAPGAAGIAGVGQDLINRAGGFAGAVSPTLDLAGVPRPATLTPGDFRTAVAQGPIQTGVAANPIRTDVAQDPIQGGVDLQRSVNSDFPAQIRQAQDAAYRQQTQYLDPQFAQIESDTRQRLADQGIQEGTPAYSRAIGDLARQKQQAYQGASDAAVAAGNEQQRALFGESLGAGQFANQASLAGGTFANTAQAQKFGQGTTLADLFNQAQQQEFGQRLAGGAFGNQAQAQQFGQGTTLANLYNQAVLAASGQGNTAAQLGLQRATAEQQTPVSTLAQLLSSGAGAYGTGTGALTGLGGLAQLFPSGPLSIPTMGGTPATIAPANYGTLAGGAAAAGTLRNSANQTDLRNLITGGNTLAQLGFGTDSIGRLAGPTGLFGTGGLLGGLFSGGGGFTGGLAGLGLGIPGIPD